MAACHTDHETTSEQAVLSPSVPIVKESCTAAGALRQVPALSEPYLSIHQGIFLAPSAEMFSVWKASGLVLFSIKY